MRNVRDRRTPIDGSALEAGRQHSLCARSAEGMNPPTPRSVASTPPPREVCSHCPAFSCLSLQVYTHVYIQTHMKNNTFSSQPITVSIEFWKLRNCHKHSSAGCRAVGAPCSCVFVSSRNFCKLDPRGGTPWAAMPNDIEVKGLHSYFSIIHKHVL